MCYLNKKKIFCGKLSKKKLKEKIGNEFILCKRERNTDIYGRILAECFIKDESLSKFMVRNGYAFDFTRYSKKNMPKMKSMLNPINLEFGWWNLSIPGYGEKKINKIWLKRWF